MSQRNSGHERKDRDLYETPEWVTEALFPHLPEIDGFVWEPACGSGKMSTVLKRAFDVISSDIVPNYADAYTRDFLAIGEYSHPACGAVITNPPHEHASDFIKAALNMPEKPVVAMLLRTDFDHAKSRQILFGQNRQFAKKIVLTKRIKWFEESRGQPSFNHAWFIWDWEHSGPPILTYGP